MSKKGFTLVELLVTISIIGILSAIGLVAYSAVLKQGRDSKRQSDLRSIQSALEMYRADKGEYPCGFAGGTCKGTSGGFGYSDDGTRDRGGGAGWVTNDDNGDCWDRGTLENVLKTGSYMADTPQDPFGGCAAYNGPSSWGYMYADLGGGWRLDGQDYCLLAKLETLPEGTTIGCDSCRQDNNNLRNYCVRSP